mgnify:CR=1 FL=1
MTIKEFMNQNKDKSIWSFAWSMFWRGWVIWILATITFGFLLGILQII